MRRGIYLHLGAHRTGTSSFQEFLTLNAGRLGDHDVNLAVANRDGAGRSGLKIRLPDARHFRNNDLAKHRVWLDEQIDRTDLNRRRITLLSEENLAGTINTTMSAAIYPIVRKRLGFVKEKLKRPVRRVLFGLRSYDTFFISAFRKRLEFRALDPFDAYRDELMQMQRGWPDVIRDIQAATEAEEIHVFRFEDMPGYEAQLHALLPTLPKGGWIEPGAAVNASPTDAACRAIQAAFHAGASLSKGDIAEIKARHAIDIDGPPVAAFSNDDAAALQARYLNDIEEVLALPFVSVVTPPPT